MSVSAYGQQEKKPSPIAQMAIPRWRGFNLLDMFTMHSRAEFPEDDFKWIRDFGFDFVRFPTVYRLWIEDGDDYKIKESMLEKLHAEPCKTSQEQGGEDDETAFCGQKQRLAAPCEYIEPQAIPPRGVEQTPLTPPKTPISETDRAKSRALDANKVPSDPDLALIEEHWPSLPEHIKAAVLALVRVSPAGD